MSKLLYEVGDLLEKKYTEPGYYPKAPNSLLVLGMNFDIKYIVMDTNTGNIIHGDTPVVEKLYKQAV